MIVILFCIIATLGIASALGTVLARNLVHAALYLVAFFFLTACQFVLLEAEFMAAMQVLVYIGAVAIILMFGIMLTRNIQGDETMGGRWFGKIPAGIIATALLAILIAGIFETRPVAKDSKEISRSVTEARPVRASWSEVLVRPEFKPPTEKKPITDPQSAAIADMSRSVGLEMLQRYLIGFEVAGLLLTAALIGAVVLAQSEESEIPKRLGPAADFRGTTTAEPELGLPAIPTADAPVSLAGAKLSPSGGTTTS